MFNAPSRRRTDRADGPDHDVGPARQPSTRASAGPGGRRIVAPLIRVLEQIADAIEESRSIDAILNA
jgi:hypothetical protein